MNDTVQQTAPDAATEAAVDAYISGNAEKAAPLFDRAAVEHRRAAATAETGTDQAWRDNEVAPLAPMPDAPHIAKTEVDAAIAKLENLGGEHAELVHEWQSTRANVGEELAYARSAFATIAANDPKLIAEVDRSGLGNHPSVLKFLATQGRLAAGFSGNDTISQRNTNLTSSPKASANRGGSETQTELDTIMRQNPPGTALYRQPHIQERVAHLSGMLAGSGNVIGRGGRNA